MHRSGLRPVRRHRWRLTPAQAIALQSRMRARLTIRDGPRTPRLIAGADVAYSKEHNRCFAAVVLIDVPSLQIVEQVTAESKLVFPYVPGLLTFREGPALLAAFARLKRRPDLIMFDGQGLAHPRRFGLASHLGYLLGIPSIGCAKSILVGEHRLLGQAAGSSAWMVDRGERVGAAVRTRDGVCPIYVSPGDGVGFRQAIRLALMATGKCRIPEPTRQADILVGRFKREWLARRKSDKRGRSEPSMTPTSDATARETRRS